MILSLLFLVKQKAAYEMRISDWSSDVCSSDRGRQTNLIGVENAIPTKRRHLRVPPLRMLFIDPDTHGLRDCFEITAPDPVIISEIGIAIAALGTIGRASCRESVCQYVSIAVVAA